MYIIIGVYRRNKHKIEKKILEKNKNAKKSLRTEILEYIRISTTKDEIDINKQFINFENRII